MQYYIDYQDKNQQDLKLLLDKIHKEYDKETLKQEKAKLEQLSNNNLLKYSLIGGGVILFFGLGGVLWIMKNRQKKQTPQKEQTKELKEVIKEQVNLTEEVTKKEVREVVTIDYEDYAPINRKTVDYLLDKLTEFEEERHFLASNTRLNSLAERFNTNRKYLSKVIKISRGKSFNDYLNDLRFAYLEDQFKTDEDFKRKSVKEICDILGYASPESFSNLFREYFDCSPKEYNVVLDNMNN